MLTCDRCGAKSTALERMPEEILTHPVTHHVIHDTQKCYIAADLCQDCRGVLEASLRAHAKKWVAEECESKRPA